MAASQFRLDAPWQLHPRVALRPEPFGAMAYHYDNRRLNFLRSHDLVAVVRALGEHATIVDTYSACEIAESRRPAFNKALASLAASDFIIEQKAAPSADRPSAQPTTSSPSAESDAAPAVSRLAADTAESP